MVGVGPDLFARVGRVLGYCIYICPTSPICCLAMYTCGMGTLSP